MLRTSLILVTALFVCAGCNRGRPAARKARVEELPVLEAKSGGEMILLPAGSFIMGETGRDDETPHTVAVSSFYLDKVTVTQELYEKVMGVNPSKRRDPQCPVERTQWTDAVRFCNKCSELDGLAPCYNLESWECNFAASGYRLPTEAEWEYACRGGTAGKFGFGNEAKDLPQYAWIKLNSQGRTQPVGQRQPNRWGLYDMHGNVWQWCNDWYGDIYYPESPRQDPRGPATGKMRVLRGGAWDCAPDKCRAAARYKEFPTFGDACFGADSYGFRRTRTKDADPAAVAVVTPRTTPDKDNKAEPKVEKPPVEPPPSTGKLSPARLRGTIIFVSDRGGSLKIWSMHASGKNFKQLTRSDGADADPRFSPDGKRILYTTLRGGFPEVWVMNRDGSDPQYVTKGSQGSWAPDGNSIVFINDNQTFVRDLDSRKERLVTPKSWERCGVPAFSPDGKRIAVASRHQGSVGIFLVDLGGKDPVALKTEEACCTPCWSKDGKRILCQSEKGHIHEVGADGKNWDRLTSAADVQHDARYSPDGTMILFCRAPAPEGPWQICVQRLDGEESDYAVLTKKGSNMLPDWHGDE